MELRTEARISRISPEQRTAEANEDDEPDDEEEDEGLPNIEDDPHPVIALHKTE